jgi:hypothetical protein
MRFVTQKHPAQAEITPEILWRREKNLYLLRGAVIHIDAISVSIEKIKSLTFGFFGIFISMRKSAQRQAYICKFGCSVTVLHGTEMPYPLRQ